MGYGFGLNNYGYGYNPYGYNANTYGFPQQAAGEKGGESPLAPFTYEAKEKSAVPAIVATGAALGLVAGLVLLLRGKSLKTLSNAAKQAAGGAGHTAGSEVKTAASVVPPVAPAAKPPVAAPPVATPVAASVPVAAPAAASVPVAAPAAASVPVAAPAAVTPAAAPVAKPVSAPVAASVATPAAAAPAAVTPAAAPVAAPVAAAAKPAVAQVAAWPTPTTAGEPAQIICRTSKKRSSYVPFNTNRSVVRGGHAIPQSQPVQTAKIASAPETNLTRSQSVERNLVNAANNKASQPFGTVLTNLIPTKTLDDLNALGQLLTEAAV